MLDIAEFGNESDGFVGSSQANRLNSRFDVPTSQAMGVLRIAKYLYNRVSEASLDVADAASQVDSIASGLNPPLSITDPQRNAIERILSYKREYEISEAHSKALADVPHFSDVSGSWGVKLFQTRAGESVRVPVMTLTLTWHDGSGDHHETFIQLSDEDWEDLGNKIKDLDSRRKLLNELLGS